MPLHLELTCAHHDDNQFYNLGHIVHEVAAETLFAALPSELPHVCDDNNMCFLVDLCDESGTIHDNREVSQALATTLLGRDLTEAIRADRECLIQFGFIDPDEAANQQVEGESS